MASVDENAPPAFTKPAAKLLAALAFAIPIGALSLGGYFQIGEWPSAMAPFGFIRIATAYLLLCSPLVWWISYCLAGWCRPIWEALTLLSVLAGLVVAGCTLAVSSGFGIEMGNDWLQRHVFRVVWVAALQFPFAFASSVLARTSNPASRRIRMLDFAIAIALVAIVPITFTDFVVRRQISVLQTANRNLQRHTALGVAKRLNLFDCSVPELPAQSDAISARARAFRQTRNGLVAEELRLADEIADVVTRIRNAEPRTDDQIVGLALDHYSLGHFSKARDLLSQRDLAESNEWGALVMGYISEQQNEPAAAAIHYERAIELESATESPRPNRLSSAYERLANTLRASGQASVAESALQNGIQQHPEIADRLTLQLGEHYSQAGRTQEAIDVFESLADRDDFIGARAQSQIEALKASIGICFVRAN